MSRSRPPNAELPRLTTSLWQEVLKVAHDAVTSKGTRRAIVKLALLTGSSLALLFLSIIATAVFFVSYIPDKARTWPVYLQYG